MRRCAVLSMLKKGLDHPVTPEEEKQELHVTIFLFLSGLPRSWRPQASSRQAHLAGHRAGCEGPRLEADRRRVSLPCAGRGDSEAAAARGPPRLHFGGRSADLSAHVCSVLRLGSQMLGLRKSTFKKLSFTSAGPFLFMEENAKRVIPFVEWFFNKNDKTGSC